MSPTKTHPTVASALLLLLTNAITLASANDAPTTSITTVWCPEDFGAFRGFYQTFASVIAADATATTYRLDCNQVARGGVDCQPADNEEGMTCEPVGLGYDEPDFERNPGCSAWPSITFTVGPSTAQIWAVDTRGMAHTRAVACELGPKAAQCDFILDGRAAEAMAQTGRWPMDPMNGTEYEFYSQVITITAGLEKLTETKTRLMATGTIEGGGAKETGTGLGASSASRSGNAWLRPEETGGVTPSGGATSGACSVFSRGGMDGLVAGVVVAAVGIYFA